MHPMPAEQLLCRVSCDVCATSWPLHAHGHSEGCHQRGSSNHRAKSRLLRRTLSDKYGRKRESQSVQRRSGTRSTKVTHQNEAGTKNACDETRKRSVDHDTDDSRRSNAGNYIVGSFPQEISIHSAFDRVLDTQATAPKRRSIIAPSAKPRSDASESRHRRIAQCIRTQSTAQILAMSTAGKIY